MKNNLDNIPGRLTAGETVPPAGGGIPEIAYPCAPPYWRQDSVDGEGNPIFPSPPSSPPKIPFGSRSRPGDFNDWGQPPDSKGSTGWCWIPLLDPPHPNDRRGLPEDWRLPDPIPEDAGNPSWWDGSNPGDGNFREDDFNRQFKFWQDLWNPNNPGYSEVPRYFVDGWPGWRMQWDMAPFEEGVGTDPNTPPVPTTSEDKIRDYLRDTGQDSKQPIKIYEWSAIRRRRFTGEYEWSLSKDLGSWTYYGCPDCPRDENGNIIRHPDAPPTRFEDLPGWGGPFDNLPEGVRKAIPRDLYELCRSKFVFPVLSPVGAEIADTWLKFQCDQLRNRPMHPLSAPFSPFVLPDGGLELPPNIPEGIIPAMIPSRNKWKYFPENDCGWFEWTPPAWAPSPFDEDGNYIPWVHPGYGPPRWGSPQPDPNHGFPGQSRDFRNNPKWNPDGTPNLDWDLGLDEDGNPWTPTPSGRWPERRRRKVQDDGRPVPGRPSMVPYAPGEGTRPGFFTPCCSENWYIPISPLPANIRDTTILRSIPELFDENGISFFGTDFVSETTNINQYFGQFQPKTMTRILYPLSVGPGYIRSTAPNALLLAEKNPRKYTRKMNELYRWKTRYSR